MKIEFDENDLSYIEKINEDLKASEQIPLFIGTVGKRYFIEFTCEDIAKANAFAMMFMNPNTEKVQELKEKLGITVNCISYCSGDSKLEEFKRYLEKMLHELEQMQQKV